jgi:hypothetical protein
LPAGERSEQIQQLLSIGGCQAVADAIAAPTQLEQGCFEFCQLLERRIAGSASVDVLLQDFALPCDTAFDRGNPPVELGQI